jgi:hypothetical protein
MKKKQHGAIDIIVEKKYFKRISSGPLTLSLKDCKKPGKLFLGNGRNSFWKADQNFVHIIYNHYKS